MSSFLKGAGKFLGVVAVILLIAIGVLNIFFVDYVTVGHNAMAPTVVAGDTILVWRGARLEHGSIALCRHPTEAGRWVMGRVMGLRGQSLREDRGVLHVDGRRTSHDIRGTVEFFDVDVNANVRMRWGWEELGNDDHLFFDRLGRRFSMRAVTNIQGLYLLSDNRTARGEDSRTFGVVQEGSCTGAAFMRVIATDGVPAEIPHGHLDILD